MKAREQWTRALPGKTTLLQRYLACKDAFFYRKLGKTIEYIIFFKRNAFDSDVCCRVTERRYVKTINESTLLLRCRIDVVSLGRLPLIETSIQALFIVSKVIVNALRYQTTANRGSWLAMARWRCQEWQLQIV